MLQGGPCALLGPFAMDEIIGLRTIISFPFMLEASGDRFLECKTNKTGFYWYVIFFFLHV